MQTGALVSRQGPCLSESALPGALEHPGARHHPGLSLRDTYMWEEKAVALSARQGRCE